MKQYIKAFISDAEENAWKLIDEYMKREWGEILYNESARAILVMELPFDIYLDDEDDYYEGTCAAVVNLKDHELYYRVFDNKDDWEEVVKYDSLDDMIAKLLQPMADGKITEETFREYCEDHY